MLSNRALPLVRFDHVISFAGQISANIPGQISPQELSTNAARKIKFPWTETEETYQLFSETWFIFFKIGNEYLLPSFIGQSEWKLKKNTILVLKISIFWKTWWYFSRISVKRKLQFFVLCYIEFDLFHIKIWQIQTQLHDSEVLASNWGRATFWNVLV